MTTTQETPKRNASRPKRSYAETVSKAQVMTTGLRNNAEAVAKRGIDDEFVTALETNRTQAITLNDEQERLKAELKVKTETLDQAIARINAALSEARKVVKLAIPQAQWKEFGIEDKR